MYLVLDKYYDRNGNCPIPSQDERRFSSQYTLDGNRFFIV